MVYDIETEAHLAAMVREIDQLRAVGAPPEAIEEVEERIRDLKRGLPQRTVEGRGFGPAPKAVPQT